MSDVAEDVCLCVVHARGVLGHTRGARQRPLALDRG